MTCPQLTLNPSLPDFHHPNRLCIPLLGSQEINPGREAGADTIAFVNPHLTAGDVVEAEPLAFVSWNRSEGGEWVRFGRYSILQPLIPNLCIFFRPAATVRIRLDEVDLVAVPERSGLSRNDITPILGLSDGKTPIITRPPIGLGPEGIPERVGLDEVDL